MSTRGVKPGDVLGGKYKVERVLGVGGMGVVVAARHIDLDQLVALKFMLKEAMADAAHAERFLREAKAAVQLKSAHTARVLDVGRLNNGEPFMVMEYLDGRDLDAELQARGPLPPHVAVDFILQASEALAEAHGRGMVHRDVKLKNLFLTTTVDGRPLVKVLDFGLAKRIGTFADVSLTASNTVFGSPQYMSPEQLRSSKDVDCRTDIWSLGVCLYELLTGRVPYDGGGLAEICAMVLKDPVPRPSQFVHDLPSHLEEVVLKCLDKDVNRRFQSVAELAFALESYSGGVNSGHHILSVMQAAQRADAPTSSGATVASDAATKTINAWDSNLPLPRTWQRNGSPSMFAALGGLTLIALLGMAMAFSTLKAKTTSSVTAPSELPSPTEPPARLPAEGASGSTLPTVAVSAMPNATETAEPISTGDAPPPPPLAKAGAGRTKSPRSTTIAPIVKPTVSAAPAKPPTKPKNGPGSGAEYM
jgi:serine/threonine-protein kinase